MDVPIQRSNLKVHFDIDIVCKWYRCFYTLYSILSQSPHSMWRRPEPIKHSTFANQSKIQTICSFSLSLSRSAFSIESLDAIRMCVSVYNFPLVMPVWLCLPLSLFDYDFVILKLLCFISVGAWITKTLHTDSGEKKAHPGGKSFLSLENCCEQKWGTKIIAMENPPAW